MPSFCCQHGQKENCPCIGCQTEDIEIWTPEEKTVATMEDKEMKEGNLTNENTNQDKEEKNNKRKNHNTITEENPNNR